MDDTPVAPLGLERIGLPMCYTPITSLRLFRLGVLPDLQAQGLMLLHSTSLATCVTVSPRVTGKVERLERFLRIVDEGMSWV